ncbi:hypothetical protein RUM43_000707 [Polyplax serrata]|uniref:Coiled-coil domain-containing protein 12 n=1 Tax=Polyplax serrata TaxID=468196 RepID=A0AAN8XPF8_POLSC
MAADDSVGSLEEESLKRKERLKALKRKFETSEIENESTSNENSNSVDLPKPKFRSYRPQDEKLKEQIIEDAKPGNVEIEVKEQLEAASSKVVIDELDISNLAPRKPDWDLKRDLAKKLEKLERRTHRAIAELIRERLKNEITNLDMGPNVPADKETKTSKLEGISLQDV